MGLKQPAGSLDGTQAQQSTAGARGRSEIKVRPLTIGVVALALVSISPPGTSAATRLASVLPPTGSSTSPVPIPSPALPSVPPPPAALPSPPPARSLDDYLAAAPDFAPIDGLDEAVWKQPCGACHKWTPALLCQQGKGYASAPANITRHAHPFGGEFKRLLKAWAESGCK